MIHMLSRFDLKPGVSLDEWRESYARLFDGMRELGFVEATGPVGTRVSNTPMDTDAENAPRHYILMSFRDRAQLDASYDYLEQSAKSSANAAAHIRMYRGTINQTFTCWEDAV